MKTSISAIITLAVLVTLECHSAFGQSQNQSTSLEIHVAPHGGATDLGIKEKSLETLPGILDRLVELRKSGKVKDVTVVIEPGVYRVEKTLIIGPEHVPPNGKVRFIAKGKTVPTISGGRRIDGWKEDANGNFVTEIPEVAAGKWKFRELFVNGKRRPRARHPNKGYLRAVKAFPDKRSGFYFKPGEIPKMNGTAAELVFLHDWSITRVAVKSINLQQNKLTAAHPIGCKADHYSIDHFEAHPRYYLENDPAFLDKPGEWYLDEKTGQLTYHPLPGETPEKIEAVAPVVGQLLIVRGTEEKPIRNVHFSGLRFAHAAWELPPGGYASGQASVHEWRDSSDRHSSRKMMESAISFEMATDCSITNCHISQMGRTAVSFGSRTHRCRLESNVFEDISGNSINLGEDTSRRVQGRAWWQSAPKQAASHHTVVNNLIQDGGQQFFGSVAIWVGIAHHMQIKHNLIRRHPYTGISLGWMWNPTPTPAGHHLVEKNHIHHVMQVLSDGGGIYTLGRQPGSIFRANHIHDIPLNAGRAESNGMFLDQGSDQFTIAGNLIYGVVRSPLRFHQAKAIDVNGNVLVVPDPKTPAYRYNRTDPMTIERTKNTVVEAKKFELSAYRSLVEGAGLLDSKPLINANER